MHRIATSIAVLAAAATAGAEPVPCVDIARAPDDVRAVVERWLAAQSCAISLEVRIVPTDGGLYVLARDERGATRDRVVPDAQTAGALIASWAAGDGQPAPSASVDVHVEVTPSPPTTPPMAPPAPPVDPFAAPGLVPPRLVDAAPSGTRARQWVGVSAFTGIGNLNDELALRAELDVLVHPTWMGGIALTLRHGYLVGPGGMQTSEIVDLSDTSATAYVAYPIRRGGWTVRPAVGLGVLRTGETDELTHYAPAYMKNDVSSNQLTPVGEASIVVSRDLVGALGVTAGAVLTAFDESLPATTFAPRRTVDFAVGGGLRIGL